MTPSNSIQRAVVWLMVATHVVSGTPAAAARPRTHDAQMVAPVAYAAVAEAPRSGATRKKKPRAASSTARRAKSPAAARATAKAPAKPQWLTRDGSPEAQALEHYQEGRFDAAIQLLQARIEGGRLRGDTLLRARELLARSYVRARQPSLARGIFKVMLYQEPAYRPDRVRVPTDERMEFELALRQYTAELAQAPVESVGLPPPSTPPVVATTPPASSPEATRRPTTVRTPLGDVPARPRVSPAATPPPIRVSRGGGMPGWLWWTAGVALAGAATAIAVQLNGDDASTPAPSPGGGITPPLPSYPPPPP